MLVLPCPIPWRTPANYELEAAPHVMGGLDREGYRLLALSGRPGPQHFGGVTRVEFARQSVSLDCPRLCPLGDWAMSVRLHIMTYP